MRGVHPWGPLGGGAPRSPWVSQQQLTPPLLSPAETPGPATAATATIATAAARLATDHLFSDSDGDSPFLMRPAAQGRRAKASALGARLQEETEKITTIASTLARSAFRDELEFLASTEEAAGVPAAAAPASPAPGKGSPGVSGLSTEVKAAMKEAYRESRGAAGLGVDDLSPEVKSVMEEAYLESAAATRQPLNEVPPNAEGSAADAPPFAFRGAKGPADRRAYESSSDDENDWPVPFRSPTKRFRGSPSPASGDESPRGTPGRGYNPQNYADQSSDDDKTRGWPTPFRSPLRPADAAEPETEEEDASTSGDEGGWPTPFRSPLPAAVAAHKTRVVRGLDAKLQRVANVQETLEDIAKAVDSHVKEGPGGQHAAEAAGPGEEIVVLEGSLKIEMDERSNRVEISEGAVTKTHLVTPPRPQRQRFTRERGASGDKYILQGGVEGTTDAAAPQASSVLRSAESTPGRPANPERGLPSEPPLEIVLDLNGELERSLAAAKGEVEAAAEARDRAERRLEKLAAEHGELADGKKGLQEQNRKLEVIVAELQGKIMQTEVEVQVQEAVAAEAKKVNAENLVAAKKRTVEFMKEQKAATRENDRLTIALAEAKTRVLELEESERQAKREVKTLEEASSDMSTRYRRADEHEQVLRERSQKLAQEVEEHAQMERKLLLENKEHQASIAKLQESLHSSTMAAQQAEVQTKQVQEKNATLLEKLKEREDFAVKLLAEQKNSNETAKTALDGIMSIASTSILDQKEMEDVRQANKEYQKSITDLEGQLTSSRELAAGLEDRVEKLTREKAVLTLQRQVQHVSAGSAEAAQQEVHAEYQKVIADLEARLVAAKGEAKSLADDAEAILQERAELASQSAKSVPIADLAALSSNIDTILVNSPASKAEAAGQRAEQQLREQQELLDAVRREAATAAAELAAKDKEVQHLSQALRGLMTVPKPKARGASWTWTTFLSILGMACSYLLFQNLDALAALMDRALADGGPSLYKPHLPAT